MSKKHKRKKGRIKVSSAKGKGRAWQQKVRDLFLSITDLKGEPFLKPDWIESRQMGGAGEDVRFLTPEGRLLFPFYVEAKAHRTGFNPHKMMEELQEREAKGKGRWPVIFHKRDRGDGLVTMEMELFQQWLQAYYGRDVGVALTYALRRKK